MFLHRVVCFSRRFREACCLHFRFHSISSGYMIGNSEAYLSRIYLSQIQKHQKMEPARSPETSKLTYTTRCKIPEDHGLRNSEVLNVVECKQYGAHTRHSVNVHIAFMWFKTWYSLVQTFWGHIMTIVLEYVCWTFKTHYQTTRCHNSQVFNKKQISHLSICGQR